MPKLMSEMKLKKCGKANHAAIPMITKNDRIRIWIWFSLSTMAMPPRREK